MMLLSILLIQISNIFLILSFQCYWTIFPLNVLAIPEQTKEIRNIIFLGDSLIFKPVTLHDMFDMLEKLLITRVFQTNYSIQLINEGVGSDTIARIYKRLDDVLNKYSDIAAVILFWDTDCSDTDESQMTLDEVISLRETYYQTVLSTCTRILSTGASLAIAGPEVLGEGLGYFTPAYWHSKTQMLNDYRDINRNISSLLAIPYLDIRESFLNDAVNFPFFCLYDTADGEHPNNRGSLIEASAFAAQINSWIFNSSSPLYAESLVG